MRKALLLIAILIVVIAVAIAEPKFSIESSFGNVAWINESGFANFSDMNIEENLFCDGCVDPIDVNSSLIVCDCETYNPYTTGRNCSRTWWNDCDNATLDDAFNCNGTQSSSGDVPRVTEVYINATYVQPNEEINVTCTFRRLDNGNNSMEIWYNDTINWYQVAHWDNTTGATENESTSFKVNSTGGTHIVRCVISHCFPTALNPINDSCVDISNDPGCTLYYYDNDDANFSVNSSGVTEIEDVFCREKIYNITANNSKHLNSYSSSFFCPLNASACGVLTEVDPRWSGNYTLFNDSWSTTYNSTYDANIDTNASTACSGSNVLTGDGECVANYNTTDDMFTACDNFTFHRYDETITWTNLSTWNLDVLWSGNLLWGNLTGYNLDTSWTGELGWANLTKYPSACSAGDFVTAVGDTLTCDTPSYTTDTNASTECSGTTTYLDGEGNCDDISGVYYDVSGDTLSGNMNTTTQNISHINSGTNYYNSTGHLIFCQYNNDTHLIISGDCQ